MGKRRSHLSDCSDDENKLTKKRNPKKHSEKKSLKDSDLEEGEVTDTDSSEEFDDGYDSDLMGDAEDRLRLSQMTEKEREQEIFRRVEARETMKTRFNIEKKLKRIQRRELRKQRLLFDEKFDSPSTSDARERLQERKKAAENGCGRSDKKPSNSVSKIRRENSHEFDDKENRLKDTHFTSSKKNIALLEDSANTSHIFKTKLKASDVYSDDSDSSSSEQIIRKRKLKKKQVSSTSSSSSDSESERKPHVRNDSVKVQYISTKQQLSQMKLSRLKLEKFVNLPFFKRVALGCFVKISVGLKKGRIVYKIGEIVDVDDGGKIYKLGNIQTNKVLKLKHGSLEREFRVEYVSNKEFTEKDFHKWRDSCSLQGVKMPTVERMESKVKDIKEALLFELTVEEIEKLISEKERFKTIPREVVAKRSQLKKDYDSARATNDTDRAGELLDELNEIDERCANLDQFRTSTISSINYVNDRNHKHYVVDEEKNVPVEMKLLKESRVDDGLFKKQTKIAFPLKAKKSTMESEEPLESAEMIITAASSPVLIDRVDKVNDSPTSKMSQKKEDYGAISRSLYKNSS